MNKLQGRAPPPQGGFCFLWALGLPSPLRGAVWRLATSPAAPIVLRRGSDVRRSPTTIPA